jgi:hypothetical protein
VIVRAGELSITWWLERRDLAIEIGRFTSGCDNNCYVTIAAGGFAMGTLVLGKCALWTAKPPSDKPGIGMIRDLWIERRARSPSLDVSGKLRNTSNLLWLELA